MLFLCRSKEEKALDLSQRKQCIEKLIENEFPLKLWIFSFALNVFFSIAAIGFQYLAVSVEASNYFVYAGFTFIYLIDFFKIYFITIYIQIAIG